MTLDQLSTFENDHGGGLGLNLVYGKYIQIYARDNVATMAD